MERDRGAALIIQLAYDGFDFAKADILDPRWWLKLEWAMDEHSRRRWASTYEMRQKNLLAIALRREIPMSGAESCFNEAQHLTEMAMELKFPWLAQERDKREWADQMRDGWVETWGDPDDPETQKKIMATLAWLDKNTAKVGRSAYG